MSQVSSTKSLSSRKALASSVALQSSEEKFSRVSGSKQVSHALVVFIGCDDARPESTTS